MKRKDNELKAININPNQMLLDCTEEYWEERFTCYHDCCNVTFYGEEFDFDMEVHEEMKNNISFKDGKNNSCLKAS